MELGIFARTFDRASYELVFDAVVAHGLSTIQFNMISAGLANTPDSIPAELPAQIRAAADSRGLRIASLSGTFNMIHPDPAERARGIASLRQLAAANQALGAPVITLCTGTRDPDNMWRGHPGNDLPDAFEDLLAVMAPTLEIAEAANVIVGVEPEVSNVINSPRKARRLLDTMASPHLKIVMDGANVFPHGGLERQHEILDEAFELLGDDIVLAHAKDVSQDGEAGHDAAGTGRLDYDHYIRLLQQSKFDGAIVLHSLTEAQVPGCIAFVRSKLRM